MISIQQLNKPETSQLSLFLFHWAGGSANSFKLYGKFLEKQNVTMYGICLPGRNGRLANSMFSRMDKLIEAIQRELLFFLQQHISQDQPIYFFGHSLGGLVAFELVRCIEKSTDYSCKIKKLIVSAVDSPSYLSAKNSDFDSVLHHRQQDQELFDYIKAIGGMLLNHCIVYVIIHNIAYNLYLHLRFKGLPLGVHPSFLRNVLPTVKSDYEIFETYNESEFGPAKIGCPLTLFVAENDISVDSGATEAWKDQTVSMYNEIRFPGSHFYLLDPKYQSHFLQALIKELKP